MVAPDIRVPRRHLRTSDLRGLAQLATEATASVTRIAEGVHQSVWDTLGVRGGAEPGQTGGITGFVYQSIRGVAQWLGQGTDALLARFEATFATSGVATPDSVERASALAVLNGVMGDHLVDSNNPFAASMSLHHAGQAIDLRETLPLPEATGKLLILMHGLCLNETHWRTRHQGREVDHGAALSAALGYTPVYLRYNSGLHTSHNGRELSDMLERLVDAWPIAVDEIAIVAHSMGGLVARGACHHAEHEALKWRTLLRHIAFLGTPHHGAPLERAGNWVDRILVGTPYTAPFALLGKLRSSGITDLRHGHVVDEDWQGRDRFHGKPDARKTVPLPEGVRCHTVAATAAAKRSAIADRLIGDGLVPVHSALGQHDDERRALKFPPASQWIAYGTNHMQLLGSPAVSQQLLRWLAPTAAS